MKELISRKVLEFLGSWQNLKGSNGGVPHSELLDLGILYKKQTPWLLVRERTILTDRPPLVDEV
jgi:hypothetical protein